MGGLTVGPKPAPPPDARWRAAALLLVALSPLVPAAAQPWDTPMADAEPVQAASLQTGEAIAVDGVFDEPAWQRAQVVTDFVGIYPTEGFAPADQTTVRVLADEQKLYLAFDCRWSERVRGYVAEREDVNLDDQIGIYLDTFGDARRTVIIYINALGIQQDAIVSQDSGWNGAWDAVFRSVGRLTETGFAVEVAIPFRSLRFPVGSPRPWRVRFTRKFASRDEKVAYPASRSDLGSFLLQYVPLLGIAPRRSGAGVEVLPTVTGSTGQDRVDGELRWRPFRFPGTIDPGIGLKVQATPGLTFDGTFNPDFSQIEADPNQIDNNLRFALYFAERRPFFLEGSELYEGSLLYSRSIVDPLFGLKFSGKQGPVSVALLQALDENPAPSFVGERDTPGFDATTLTGANSLVSQGGLKLDLGDRSRISFAYSDKQILGKAGGERRAGYHGAYVGGRVAPDSISNLDYHLAYSYAGARGGDGVQGARLEVNGARVARLWQGGGGWSFVTPGYRAENGFLTRPDLMEGWGWLRKRFEWEGAAVRWVTLGFDVSHSFEGFAPGASVRNADGNRILSASVRLPAITDVSVDGGVWDSQFRGQTFAGGRGRLSVSNAALEWLRFSAWGQLRDRIRFSDSTKTLESQASISLWFRALRRVNVQLDTTASWLGKPDEPLTRQVVWRARTIVGILPSMQVRAIVQGSDRVDLDVDRELAGRADDLALSLLFSWLPSPGTSVRVGFGERWTWQEGTKPETQQRDLFAKASVLIRL